MKYTLSAILCCLIQTTISAQWSNTNNNFTDAAHMPVVTATSTQQYPMVINSYPDGGYFVYWEDDRSSSTNQRDIYAQKYDKNGNKLWGANGKPVANGKNNEHFYTSQNSDYRNYSYACTDSANGFYICYVDDSINNGSWNRIFIQHIKSNGNKVFAKGFIVARTPSGSTINFSYPQLVADGNGGCFVSYIENYGYTNEPNIYCYKDINGTMQFYGGGFVVRYYTSTVDQCPTQLQNVPLVIQDYMIYPNLQNGCNIVATVNGGSGNETYFTAFNSVVRIKKNKNITTDDGTVIKYKQDNVLVYYQPSWHTVTVTCPGGGIGTAYLVDGLGFAGTGIGGYSTAFSKGVAIKTDGNIVVNAVAAANRRLVENTPGNWFTQMALVQSEVYDAVPYAFTQPPYHPNFFNDKKPGTDSIVGSRTDTIVSNNSPYAYEFSQKVTGDKIYFAARANTDPFIAGIYLQTFQFSKKKTHQYQVTYASNNQKGVNIGNEISTGFSGSNIGYGNPQLTADTSGFTLLYVNENGRAPRVSPIINNTQLAWGAMGRRIGSGASPAGYYGPDKPVAVLDAKGGRGFIALEESRNENNAGVDIYARHLDSVARKNYTPLLKPVKNLQFGNLQAMPETMVGSSKGYSLVEILNYNGGTGVFDDASPLLQVLDNRDFGIIQTQVYQNVGAIRLYNNKPYLNRNYNIQPSTVVGNAIKVNLRFFFSKDDFTALKTAYPSLTNPSKLAVIKQAASFGSAPSSYAPVAGELKLAVTSWQAVTGGYYIEVEATKFSGFNNYYIFPAANTPFALTAVNENQAVTGSKIFIEKIYPTIMTNNILYIQAGNEDVKNIRVEVFSTDGKKVYAQKLNYQSQSLQLPALANGLYNVRISAGKLLYNASLVKGN